MGLFVVVWKDVIWHEIGGVSVCMNGFEDNGYQDAWMRDEVETCTHPMVVRVHVVSGRVWYD